MGQENKKKKKKHIDKTKTKQITTFIILQIIAIVLFASMIYNSVPISPEKVESASIHVKNIDNLPTYREHRVFVYTENDTYIFPNMASFQLTNEELVDKIKEEEQIFIKYCERYSFILGHHKFIVDARSESEMYLSLDEFNSKRPLIGVIFLILILESILIGACVTYYIFYHGLQFSRKKHKKKKHNNSIKNST